MEFRCWRPRICSLGCFFFLIKDFIWQSTSRGSSSQREREKKAPHWRRRKSSVQAGLDPRIPGSWVKGRHLISWGMQVPCSFDRSYQATFYLGGVCWGSHHWYVQSLTPPLSAPCVITHLYLEQALECTPFLIWELTELPASVLIKCWDLRLWRPAT